MKPEALIQTMQKIITIVNLSTANAKATAKTNIHS